MSFNFEALMDYTFSKQGTDALLITGSAPLIRSNGELRRAKTFGELTAEDIMAVTESLLSRTQRAHFSAGKEVDFSFSWKDQARVRGNCYIQRGTPAIALRVVPKVIPSFDELRLPQFVRGLADLRQGLVFVTGPTGAGKSTTLAALVDHINKNRAAHIVTIEDPIEYVHEHEKAAVSQREVGTDTESFPEALRSALREDPDVIMVGEVRDLESIRFALTLAETGHLVFATLHTNDTAQAIDRIVDVFPGEQQPQIRVQLANALTAVVYQRLLPLKDESGMVAAFEVLATNGAARNLIREGKTAQLRNQLVTGQRDGSQTFESALSSLVTQGLVDLTVAQGFTSRPKEITA